MSDNLCRFSIANYFESLFGPRLVQLFFPAFGQKLDYQTTFLGLIELLKYRKVEIFEANEY